MVPIYRAVDPHSILADPDPAVFLNAEFSVPVVEKKHKRLLKSKKTMEQIYMKNLNNKQITFFLFLYEKIVLLDPDPNLEGKMNADPCGSGSTALPISLFLLPTLWLVLENRWHHTVGGLACLSPPGRWARG